VEPAYAYTDPSTGEAATRDSRTMRPIPSTSQSPRERDRAFEREALAYLPDVARFARSLTHDEADADDLVQETFLRAYRAWHTFEPGSNARRWLFTICRNVFLRGLERERRVADTGGEAVELDALAAVMGHVAAQRGGYDDIFDRIDLGPAIGRAIAELPEPFRIVVVLVDVEGESYEDAAAIVGVPIGTIRSRLFRGRRILQETLFTYARDAGYAAVLGPTPRADVPRPRARP